MKHSSHGSWSGQTVTRGGGGGCVQGMNAVPTDDGATGNADVFGTVAAASALSTGEAGSGVTGGDAASCVLESRKLLPGTLLTSTKPMGFTKVLTFRRHLHRDCDG